MVTRIAPEHALSRAERLRGLVHSLRISKLVYGTYPRYTTALLVLVVLRAVVPVAVLQVAKAIIDTVEQQVRHQGTVLSWDHLLSLIALEFLCVATGDGLARLASLVENAVGELTSINLSDRIMRHVGNLDLAQLEEASTRDELQMALHQAAGRTGILGRLTTTAQQIATVAALASAVLFYEPLLLVFLSIAVIPSFLGETYFGGLRYSLLLRGTPRRRMLDYLREVAAGIRSAREVKLFGLTEFLTTRAHGLATELWVENKHLAVRRAALTTAWAVAGSAAFYAGYGLIVYHTLTGHVSAGGSFTIGTLAFLTASYRQARDGVQAVLLTLSGLFEQGLYVGDLFRFLERQPDMISGHRRLTSPGLRSGIAFENVSFRYPGAAEWAVRNLTFKVGPHDHVAIVGENGAGKSTVVRLLTRLQDPTEGRILLDGADLREYDLRSLRATFGVIFQDYMRYEFTMRDNIAVGNIEAWNDLSRIRSAADLSLAHHVAARLAAGYDQQLGRLFKGGIDLSGGEWQKVALARAYVRDSLILVLDEPTSGLDPRAEYQLYRRFLSASRDRMALVVSHRFSTARAADRILVLSEGRLVEEGCHADLVERRGLYAELFAMQSEGYR